MMLARPLSPSVRRHRVTAFSIAVLINILCLWLLQYGVRVPARLRLPTRETRVELIPFSSPTKAAAASSTPPVTAGVDATRAHPHRPPASRQAITLERPDDKPATHRSEASTPAQKLDMEALRSGTRQLGEPAKNDPDAAIKLNLKPAQDESPTALSQAMGKAQRSSCKSAHANLLLLAPLALLHDAVTDTGCSWQQ